MDSRSGGRSIDARLAAATGGSSSGVVRGGRRGRPGQLCTGPVERNGHAAGGLRRQSGGDGGVGCGAAAAPRRFAARRRACGRGGRSERGITAQPQSGSASAPGCALDHTGGSRRCGRGRRPCRYPAAAREPGHSQCRARLEPDRRLAAGHRTRAAGAARYIEPGARLHAAHPSGHRPGGRAGRFRAGHPRAARAVPEPYRQGADRRCDVRQLQLLWLLCGPRLFEDRQRLQRVCHQWFRADLRGRYRQRGAALGGECRRGHQLCRLRRPAAAAVQRRRPGHDADRIRRGAGCPAGLPHGLELRGGFCRRDHPAAEARREDHRRRCGLSR